MSTAWARFSTSVNFPALFKFLTVGGLAAGINFLVFGLCFNGLHWHYQWSVSVSYVASVLFHFNANRIFTFKSHGSEFGKHVMRYLVMVLINYLLTLLVMHLVVSGLHWLPYIGVALSIAATVGGGYLMSNYWVFVKTRESV